MKRNEEVIMQEVAGERLLVPIGAQVVDLNGLITLNETGAYLWDMLAEEHSPEDLAQALAERFDVDAATARLDVLSFVDEITRLGLLR
jgi:sensor domain CHASE-containing protein